jgi:HSP20 family protein
LAPQTFLPTALEETRRTIMAKTIETKESPVAKESGPLRPWYRRNPWLDHLPRPLARLERDFEYLMDRVLNSDARRYLPWAEIIPAANLAETESEFEVTIELPGIDSNDVHVELRNGDLWITGETKGEKEGKGKTFHRVERCSGNFQRVIPLPGAIDEEKIDAIYKNGVLTISLPKSKEAQPKPIQVKT